MILIHSNKALNFSGRGLKALCCKIGSKSTGKAVHLHKINKSQILCIDYLKSFQFYLIIYIYNGNTKEKEVSYLYSLSLDLLVVNIIMKYNEEILTC